MIAITYFIGNPMGILAPCYIIPFQTKTEKISGFGNNEWLQTLPYMSYFMQLVKQSPLLMKDGDIFLAKKENDWEPAWKLEDVVFVKDEQHIPLQDLIYKALLFVKNEQYKTVTMQLFRPGINHFSRAKEIQDEQSALLMLMAFDQFKKQFADVEMTINVNFDGQQSAGYQIFQQQHIQYLGIK